MAEIRTVTTLEAKRREIARAIVSYEEKLKQARADLAHIQAAIKIFGVQYGLEEIPPYTSLKAIYGWGEMRAMALAALRNKGPQTTKEIASELMKAKGLDAGDRVLLEATMLKMVQVLRRMQRNKLLKDVGRRAGCIVWSA